MGESDEHLVSIVVPSCDRRDALARCIESLRRQTHTAIEIVAVDDASVDDTPAMLETLSREEERLVVVRNDTNRGANASRNRGIEQARGVFVAFLDSDCIAEPDWIERILEDFGEENVVAVTGLVEDTPARNIYELTFRGTHRIGRRGPAPRMVSGNLCVRRSALGAGFGEHGLRPPVGADGQPDTSFSGACDEEGLFLRLREAGVVMANPSAVVHHDHAYDRRAFFRQAYHGGRAAADLVARHDLRGRLDMSLFIVPYALLPVALICAPWFGWRPMLVPALGLLVALAAITYNDLFRKGKTPWQVLVSFPMLVAYYHVRLIGYVRRRVATLRSSAREGSVRLQAYRALRRTRDDRRYREAVVHDAPIFIYGNQKSGTSAIASLLGRLADVETSIDLPREMHAPTFHRVRAGEMSIDDFIERNKLEFSRPIIKAPNLMLLDTQLVERFPEARFVFIVRDPRDNIRSILDRMELPGDGTTLSDDQRDALAGGRRLLIDGGWLGFEQPTYVGQLAERWNLYVRTYLANESRFRLIRYEDFLGDKQGEIERLAADLELPARASIGAHLDTAYQPAGDRDVDWAAFFGANLATIDEVCGELMPRFGYAPGAVRVSP